MKISQSLRNNIIQTKSSKDSHNLYNLHSEAYIWRRLWKKLCLIIQKAALFFIDAWYMCVLARALCILYEILETDINLSSFFHESLVIGRPRTPLLSLVVPDHAFFLFL